MDLSNVDDPIEVGGKDNDVSIDAGTQQASGSTTGVGEAVEAAEPVAEPEPEAVEGTPFEGDVPITVKGPDETNDDTTPQVPSQPPEGIPAVDPAGNTPAAVVNAQPDAGSNPPRVTVHVALKSGIAQRVPEIDVRPRPTTTASESAPPVEPTPQPVPQPAPPVEPTPQPAPPVEPTPQPSEPAQPAPQPAQPTPSVDGWAKSDKYWRMPEILTMRRDDFLMEPSITDDGALTCPFSIGDNVFLLYYSARFPSRDWGGGCPVRVYLVQPSISECPIPKGRIQFDIKADDAGLVYVSDKAFETAYQKYIKRSGGRASNVRTMADAAIELARRWSYALRQWTAQAARTAPSAVRTGPQGYVSNTLLNTFGKGGQVQPLPATGRSDFFMRLGRPTFVDGRESMGFTAPEGCKKIVFSDRAFAQIYTETQARITTETGGLMLGHFHQGVWYVIETCDPGWNGVFQVAYHEGDERYENHVAAILSRLYKHPLVFLGMWHRHPSSLDTFSGTDDITNWRYVDRCTGPGCISGLINYDPDFRMTFYFCEQAPNSSMYYTRVDVEVGDDKFVMPEMLAMATKADVDGRDWR